MPVGELPVTTLQEGSAHDADAELLRRYVQIQDRRALGELFDRLADPAYHFARRMLGNDADAHDAVQTSLVLIMRKADRYCAESGGSVRAWAMGFVLHACKNHKRSAARRADREKNAAMVPVARSGPASGVEFGEQRAALLAALERLPEHYRAPLWLRYFERLSSPEVAAALGQNESTVRNQLARGLDRLRQTLTASGFSSSALTLPTLLASLPVETAPATLALTAKSIAASGTAEGAAVSGGTLASYGGAWAAKIGVLSLAVAAIAASVTLIVSHPEKRVTAHADGAHETPHEESAPPKGPDKRLPVAPEDESEWFANIKARYTRQYKNSKDAPSLPPVTPVPRWPGQEWGYRENRFLWAGYSLVCDPVNKEALFLCGHNGGMPFGAMGSWALAEDGKTWREMKFSSAALDPLRKKAVAARKPAKDGEAAARNVFYAAMEVAKEAEAAKNAPAKLLGEAVKLTGELSAAVGAAKAEGGEKDAVEHAKPLVEKALAGLKNAKAALEGGRVDAAVLKSCFDAQWALDEAADCLANSPGPRENASAGYDRENECVVLFGGSHHDYMTNETWIYDCAKKSWRQVWPKAAPSVRMSASLAWSAEKKALILSGGQTVLNRMVYQGGEMPAPAGEWVFDAKAGEWKGEGGAPGGTRIYRTIVPGYNPCWYDAAPRGEPKATADFLAKLKPNTWTKVPMQPAPAPERAWGTARLDPDRDQIYYWTGGHQADPASQPSTYHPGINRWSIPFVPDIITGSGGGGGRKGMTFTGRPDCANHTYLHYAYDPVSKRLICPSMGGTGVYNPDTRDFEFSVDQPFNCHIYKTCSAGTSRGVILWDAGGQTWLFDHKEKAWKPFKTSGDRPLPAVDGSAMCYDAKRDVLWIATFADWQKPSGNIWRLDVKTGEFKTMNPANTETIGKAKGMNGSIRESVHVPTVDLVLYNNFVNNKNVAYDPSKNCWVVLANVASFERHQGGVNDTLNWDPRRELVWDLNIQKDIYVLKLDPKALKISADPSE